MTEQKPFNIPKEIIWEAYKRVKKNKGASGVDEVSIQDFEVNLKDNLYKLWNRMASGSYFPCAVRTVEIPKKDGGKRPLGIPTVTDRIAQMAVKMILEPEVEPHFHPDSYGYRPKKSAHEALGVTRRRCWRYDWVLEVDIKGFFDNLDHTLLMKAVRKHSSSKWVLLYIERWLKAPAQKLDGTLVQRDKGTPQGGVISPLLANIFLHYALDVWMRKNYPHLPFERYADDIVAHCQTLHQAESLKEAIGRRLLECNLELHPQKTNIVYCKQSSRKGDYPNQKFDFLGYTFRPRKVKTRDGYYRVSFTPAVSNQAATAIRRTMKRWRFNRRNSEALEYLAEVANPRLRGWINYYGLYNRESLHPIFHCLNHALSRWAMRKYKRYRNSKWRARRLLERIAKHNPKLFAHWEIGCTPTA